MYNGGVNYDVTVPTATYYPINQWTHIAATWEGDAD